MAHKLKNNDCCIKSLIHNFDISYQSKHMSACNFCNRKMAIRYQDLTRSLKSPAFFADQNLTVTGVSIIWFISDNKKTLTYCVSYLLLVNYLKLIAFPWSLVFQYHIANGFLVCALDFVDFFAVLVKDKGRHAFNSLICRDLAQLINIDLGDNESTGKFVADCFKGRGKAAAWRTPVSIEVDQDQFITVNGRVKLLD